MEKPRFTTQIDVHRARKPIRGSMIGQLTLNSWLRYSQHPMTSWTGPALSAVLGLLKSPKRLVSYQMDAVDLVLPLDHPVPIAKHKNPDHMRFYGRIAKAINQKYPDATGIVLGAGIGCSIAAIRAESTTPLIATEPDPDFYRLLNRNMLTVDNVTTDTTLPTDPAILKSVRLLALSDRTAELPRLATHPTVVLHIHPKTSELPPVAKDHLSDYSSGLLFDEFSHFLCPISVESPDLLHNLHTYFYNTQRSYTVALFPPTESDIADLILATERARATTHISASVEAKNAV